MTDYERGYEQGKADAIQRMHLEILLAQTELVQVSPLEFVTAVLEKEHLIGKPIMWAQWPNEEKNEMENAKTKSQSTVGHESKSV
jgi:hypothetical protein